MPNGKTVKITNDIIKVDVIEGSKADLLLWMANQWWGSVRVARNVFFNDFVFSKPSKRVELLSRGNSIKDFTKPQIAQKDTALSKAVIDMTDFYDKLGFFLIAGQMKYKDVLPPIWHSMRKTWLAIKHFVDIERTKKPGRDYFDPIYFFGFEKLYQLSELIKQQPLILAYNSFYESLKKEKEYDAAIFKKMGRQEEADKTEGALKALESNYLKQIKKQNDEAKEIAKKDNNLSWVVKILESDF